MVCDREWHSMHYVLIVHSNMECTGSRHVVHCNAWRNQRSSSLGSAGWRAPIDIQEMFLSISNMWSITWSIILVRKSSTTHIVQRGSQSVARNTTLTSSSSVGGWQAMLLWYLVIGFEGLWARILKETTICVSHHICPTWYVCMYLFFLQFEQIVYDLWLFMLSCSLSSIPHPFFIEVFVFVDGTWVPTIWSSQKCAFLLPWGLYKLRII